MSEKEIKVTDKRLFTPDGELRDEYRDLEASEEEPQVDPAESPAPPISEPATRPPLDHEGSKPSILDLIGVVAQPIALYLGDAKMPDGESMENLELARLYIDLLEVLETKTKGNLSEQEQSFLNDLLYQVRLRHVEKTNQVGEE